MGLGDLLATSLVRFEQAPALAAFIFRFEVSSALAAGALEGESARGALETFARLFAEAGPLREGEFAGLVERAKRETGLKGRALLHPLRAAVTGETSGPELARAVPLIDEAARLGLAPGLVSPAQRIHLVLDHEEDAGRSPDHSRQRET